MTCIVHPFTFLLGRLRPTCLLTRETGFLRAGNRPVLQRRNKAPVQWRGREWEHAADVVSTAADIDTFRDISAQNWSNNIVNREPQV